MSNFKWHFGSMLFIIFWYSMLHSAVTHTPPPGNANLWASESLFIGADIQVLDGTKPVKVKMSKSIRINAVRCNLYWMSLASDSAILLSNNLNPDTSELTLGTFPQGTVLVFMVKSIDTSLFHQRYYDKKNYSGQNRLGIDHFVSERSLPEACQCGYGARWAVVGAVNATRVEVGFEEQEDFTFRGVVFEVENAGLVGVEKHKLPRPRANFTDSAGGIYLIEMYCPAVPDTLQTYWNSVLDTTITPVDKEKITLFYTLDGTDPRTSATRADYVAPFTISATTTVKACAAIEGDTNWYPSDVVTRTYTKDPTTVARGPSFTSPQAFTSAVRRGAFATAMFDISGRRISAMDIRRSGGVVLLRQDAAVTRQVLMAR